MSVRSSRRLKNILQKKCEFDSPTVSERPVKDGISRSARKIRKTHELFYMSPPEITRKSQIKEKNVEQCSPCNGVEEENCIKPEKNKRKIVKAKRMLKPRILENGVLKSEDVVAKDADDLKWKRKLIQRQQNFELDESHTESENVIMENQNVKDEGAKCNISVTVTEEIIDNNHTHRRKLSNEVVITVTDVPLSPSLSNEENEITPISPKQLKFDCSEEEVHPSTSGNVSPSTTRRRTYELENSVNDISVLKTASERDSLRINITSTEEISSIEIDNSPTFNNNLSKVTLRRGFNPLNQMTPYTDTRLSKLSPPWMNENVKTPRRTSTPHHNLLKDVLTKDLNSDRKSKSTSKKKTVSKVKIPNFSAIHQKALDKMESITEYKQRKEDRAKLLLSGKKPKDKNESSKTEMKKQLRFAFDLLDKEKSPTFIPLPSTPFPKKMQLPKITNIPKLIPMKRPPVENKENLTESLLQMLPTKFVQNEIFKVHHVKPLTSKFCNGFNFGKKKEECKAIITTKSKPMMKNVMEKQRNLIKGVRSNRRFELLMNMRKGN